ncbi:hypothetical protein BT96DRAFT_617273 [Gymnopus androsaceus JB14]|uniref:Uncharacterized protein n=1 Tax=Gymnopus androsaceus JB14 TaxID=1447944 RepID=A0A6A4HRK0_9AGAR|nr:hypothetical protein BT96DRAFT_617273 [Gymnopus androsaceus JB14]
MSRYLSQLRIEEPIWLDQEDLSFLHTRICETEIHLGSLENQMNELKCVYEAQMNELKRVYEAQISELMPQKDAKLVEIASYRNICSPVRRVPQEILSSVLELCCLPADGIWNSTYDIIRHTSILSQVCVAWRKAAHSTPRLWSKLCLATSDSGQWKRFKKDAWLKEWIERCRDCPLDLYLSLHQRRSVSRLFESILRFGHKIRSMNVWAALSSCLPLFHLPASSFPLLEEVSFRIIDHIHDTVEALVPLFPHKISVLLDAPKLRCVRIEEYNDVPILELLALPAEQLTSLEINWISRLQDIFDNLSPKRYVHVDILCRCKALRNLKLTYTSFCLFDPVVLTGISSDLIISLPELKSLDISCDKVDGPGVALLRCLHTPHLEELSLRHGSQDIRDLSMDLTYFQQHSAAALSSLSLQEIDHFQRNPSSECLITILSLFPAIQSLWISASRFNALPLLQALTFDETHQVLLPKLTKFGLKNGSYLDCSMELTNMVLSRWWPHNSPPDIDHGLTRLQKVTLYVPGLKKLARISELPGFTLDLHTY